MAGADIARRRLRTQRLAGAGFRTPADVVRWFGAVQAQEYPGALWAVGLRTIGATEADVERAVAERTIVRSWPLRATLHFTAPEDLRWMLACFAPRMIARAGPRLKQLELDGRTLSRSAAILSKALQGERQHSRPRLYARLERAGIRTGEGRGAHILWHCAHDGLICFGAREGNQHTFALLDEWIPSSKTLTRDEALAELARRYFTSHGPAALKDFIWWSGLSAGDARAGLARARTHLHSTTIEGTVYWHGEPSRGSVAQGHAVLLPPYDEYTVAYQDRRAALDPRHAAAARNGILGPTILLDGRIIGTWTRQLTRDAVTIALTPFAKLTGARRQAVAAAADRYGRFIGRPARITQLDR
jgi:hypothetical protein